MPLSRISAYDITNTQPWRKRISKTKHYEEFTGRCNFYFSFIQLFIFIGGYSMDSAALPVVESLTMLLFSLNKRTREHWLESKLEF